MVRYTTPSPCPSGLSTVASPSRLLSGQSAACSCWASQPTTAKAGLKVKSSGKRAAIVLVASSASDCLITDVTAGACAGRVAVERQLQRRVVGGPGRPGEGKGAERHEPGDDPPHRSTRTVEVINGWSVQNNR